MELLSPKTLNFYRLFYSRKDKIFRFLDTIRSKGLVRFKVDYFKADEFHCCQLSHSSVLQHFPRVLLRVSLLPRIKTVVNGCLVLMSVAQEPLHSLLSDKFTYKLTSEAFSYLQNEFVVDFRCLLLLLTKICHVCPVKYTNGSASDLINSKVNGKRHI